MSWEIRRNLFLDPEELCQRTACYKQYSKTLLSSHLSVSLYVLGAECWLRPSLRGCYRKPCIQEQQCIWVWAVLSGSRTRLTHHNTSRNLLFGSTSVCEEVSSWSICYTFGCFYVNNENIEGIARGV